MRAKVLAWAASVAACLITVDVALLCAPWGLPLVHAQSLAEVAREEAARRKQIRQPARVYTNKDLASVPPPAAPVPAAAADSGAGKSLPAAKEEKAEADVATDTTNDAAKDRPRDQSFWSRRMKDLQAQLDRDRILAEALQSRINGLTADFSARDDPAQRTVIALDRQKALDEFERMTKNLVSDRMAIAAFEEEARRASVPPGWLR